MCSRSRTACTAARSRRSASCSASGTSASTCRPRRRRAAGCNASPRSSAARPKACISQPRLGKSGMHSRLGSVVARLAWLTLASDVLALVAIPLPAFAAEQLDMAMVEQGRQIFDTVAGVGCKACHGPFAEGKVGPTSRGVNEATIREALAKVGPMQFLREQLHDEDIKRVAAYTEWMGRHLLVRSLLKRGRFIPD